jgi:hypothetical protein
MNHWIQMEDWLELMRNLFLGPEENFEIRKKER